MRKQTQYVPVLPIESRLKARVGEVGCQQRGGACPDKGRCRLGFEPKLTLQHLLAHAPPRVESSTGDAHVGHVRVLK